MTFIESQHLPPLASYDYEALKEDIRKRGVLIPIVVNTATGQVIDGHHRMAIASELGIECPVIEIEADDDDHIDIAFSMNTARRQLSMAQKRGMAIEMKKTSPNLSQARIATRMGVSRQVISYWFGESITDANFGTGYTPINEKLSAEQKKAIFSRHKNGEAQVALAADFQVSQPAIHKAIKAEGRRLDREAALEEQRRAIESGLVDINEGPFDVLVYDPPWPYGTKYEAEGRRSANPYPEMTLDQIRGDFHGAKDDCVLWLWTTHKFMRYSFDLLDAWGFADKAILTWCKDRMGTGSWLRSQSEFCIMAVKGKPTITLTNQTTVISGKLREHSRKPDEFYALVDSLCPGTKYDRFAREARPGWAVGGNDTDKFS